jgi:hypothetical protein
LQANAILDVGDTLTELRYLRFAVGSFDTWLQFARALDDLRRRGFALDSFNYLALPRVAGKTFRTPSLPLVRIQELAFPEGLVVCTAGPLHDCLRVRLDGGAQSLKDALGYWLVPRHAAHLQAAIENGEIQLWVRLTDIEDERRAYESLLACSSDSVGVHDLAPLQGKNGSRS